MSFLEQLSARVKASKFEAEQAQASPLQSLAQKAEDYALVQKYGIAGMHRGVHNAALVMPNANSNGGRRFNMPTISRTPEPEGDSLNARSLTAHKMTVAMNSNSNATARDHTMLATRHKNLAAEHLKANSGDMFDIGYQRHNAVSDMHADRAKMLNSVKKSEDTSLEDFEYAEAVANHESVFKAYVKTGKPVGRPVGWRKNGGSVPAQNAHGAPSASSYSEHTPEALTEHFNHLGSKLGGGKYTPNVTIHSGDNADSNREKHVGLMDGHLQHLGYVKGQTSDAFGTSRTAYHHPETGAKVSLNLGAKNSSKTIGFTHEAGTSSQVPASKNPLTDAFKEAGKSFGGTQSHSNVMYHHSSAKGTAKDHANLHEGALHGHLESSGYKVGKTTPVMGGTATDYHHADGSKVTLTNAVSSSGHSVEYSHKAGSAGDANQKAADQDAADHLAGGGTTILHPKGLPAAAKPRDSSAIGADGKVDAAKFKRGLSKIASMTDINDHNNSLAHGAKLIGRPDIAAKAKAISVQHLKQGHMSDDLLKQRNDLHTELHAHAKKVLSPDQAHKLYMSY